jgi:single-stranded-DNA-specific exonuclease
MRANDIIFTLLANRGLHASDEIEHFFNPPHPKDIPPAQIGLSAKAAESAIRLVKKHLSASHPIAVYGDYDVDGICATAIVWETLYPLSHRVFPHIPDRREEGYGLSIAGINHCLEKGAKLIIALDSGIVADREIKYCLDKGCDILVIDHHQSIDRLPHPTALIHSTSTTAAGLAWFFAREFLKFPSPKLRRGDRGEVLQELLSVVSISVICDLVPLLGVNRSFAKYGLEELNHTTRPGLLALFKSAGLRPSPEMRRGGGGEVITSYHVGFIIGPRLNAMGRLEQAIDSLRLLCTTDPQRAKDLAEVLEKTNRLRQDLTQQSSDHAISLFDQRNLPPLLLVASPDYDEGVIGLIAARLVEKYYRPAIAISIGSKKSKASARSIPGFHITDFLRQFSDILDSVGGHEMAAGFTINSQDLDKFQKKALDISQTAIPREILIRNTRIDAEIELSTVNCELITKLKSFEPHGLGNPRPVFSTRQAPISYPKRVGNDAKHLKFQTEKLEAIYFSAPVGVESGMTYADIIYSLDVNTFNGQEILQLIIKNLTPR